MFLSMVQKRRSIRKYLNKQIGQDKIDIISEAMLRAPSSKGKNPWEFIIVDDVNIIGDLSKTKLHGSMFLENAPLAIVVIADTTKSDVWVEDTSIAATYIQLTAENIGLSSCWVQIRNRPHDKTISGSDYVTECLKIPAHYEVASIIGIGYADEQKPAHPEDELQNIKIHYNKF